MARVPTVTVANVVDQPLQAGLQRSSASPDLLGGPARQAQQLGAALGALGETMQRLDSEAAAKDADTEFTQAITDRLYNPDSGFMSRQGRGAVDDFERAVGDVRSMQRKVLDNVQDPSTRRLVSNILANRTDDAVRTMSRHAAVESKKWQLQSSDSRAVTSVLTAANDPANSETFAKGLVVATAEAEDQGRLQGWDAATTELRKREYTDLAYQRRYTTWAAQDPVGALTHFATSGGANMTPLEREQMRNKLFHAAAPVLAEQLNAIGGPGVVPSAPDAGKTSAPTVGPRGIRNNNPGNIVKTDRPWQGEVLGNDPRYASFESPEAGIRAMARTLTTYGEKGLTNVQDIIARWAPASENDTGAYIKAVAKQLGVDPKQSLDLKSAATMTGLVQAIIKHENGQQPYSDQQIARGVAAAGNGAGKPANLPAPAALRDPGGPTGVPLIDALPPAQRMKVIQMARTQGAQAMTVAREQLHGRAEDAKAEYLATGNAKNPPPEAEFIRAYGQVEGPRRFRDLQESANLGRQLQQVKNMPAVQMDQLLQQAKPAPGDGFAMRQHSYEVLTRAAHQVTAERQADPVAYAARSGLYSVTPLKGLDQQSLATELPRRAAAATRIAQDYGTPVALFTVPEARNLAAQLRTATVEGQKQQLALLSNAIGNTELYKRAMQAVAPDAPVVAIAGIYQARGLRMSDGRDVADLLLRGQAILTPLTTKEDGSGHQGGKSLIKMPEEKLMLSEFNAAAGDAFKGKEQAMDLFYQATKAIYAARSAEAGDYSGAIDSNRWKAAIQLATGGIQPHNGAKVVMPYGMAYDTFQDTLKSRVDELVKVTPPLAATGDELVRLPLENFGDGRYLFRRGAGFVVDKSGRPLVVDVNPRPGASTGREAFGRVQ